MAASDLTPPRVERFLDVRRTEGYVQWLSPRRVVPLLGCLRDLGVVETPASEPTAPETALLARYHDWLVSQRRLAAATARGYVDMVRPFIAARAADDGVALADLTARDVTGFVLATCRGGARGSAKLGVTALRSQLGFLGVEGLVAVSLVDAVPSVAGWRLAGLPMGLEPGEVARLLASRDRRTRVGRRDLAILVPLGPTNRGTLPSVRATVIAPSRFDVVEIIRPRSHGGWRRSTVDKPAGSSARSSQRRRVPLTSPSSLA